jgi:hypothetical protein
MGMLGDVNMMTYNISFKCPCLGYLFRISHRSIQVSINDRSNV